MEGSEWRIEPRDQFPYLKDDSVIEVQRGPEPGGVGGAYRAFRETLRGLRTTLARIVEGPLTIQYPEEKTPVYQRFRGRHKLHRFEPDEIPAAPGREAEEAAGRPTAPAMRPAEEAVGLEKCVGCSLCAAACPRRLHPGRRRRE